MSVSNFQYEELLAQNDQLKKQLMEMYPGVPILVTGIGTVLAAHLGPKVIGIFLRRKK